jgi:hypothetical protein
MATSEIAELEKISGDDISAAMELSRVFFGADCDKKLIAGAVYPFDFRQKEAEKLRHFEAANYKKEEIIRAYHGGYEKLIESITDKGDDYPFVKAGIAEIYRNYAGLYQLDAKAFYARFIKKCPLVILAMLANADMRPCIPRNPNELFNDLDINALSLPPFRQSDIDAFLKKWEMDNNQPEVQKVKTQAENRKIIRLGIPVLMLNCPDAKDLNGKLVDTNYLGDNYYPYDYVPPGAITSPLPNHIKTFSGVTEGYWKDIEPKGKKFLIIKMEDTNLIRSNGKNGEELKASDINGNFPILDGIDYKSNNASHKLVYMEV